jgi:tetratricopeptide (TPR) repeat protein
MNFSPLSPARMENHNQKLLPLFLLLCYSKTSNVFYYMEHAMGSGRHWGKIIDERDAERFVGREQELATFRQEINLTSANFFIFYITGQGGVGKTSLLNRYRDIAKESGFVLADCDERQRNVPEVLGRFAHQLAKQGFSLKHFDERYKTYRQKMNEIENDPEAPQGLASILGRTMVSAAFIGGDLVPGVRKGLDLLPQESLETQASEWAAFLTKKLTNKDDVTLLREPVTILTPLFFKDLNEIALKRKVLLCFENFEVTRQDLQEWLLHLLEYEPSEDIRIVIAGRDQPGANWDKLRNVTKTIRLDVFTVSVAETFLNKFRITDHKRRMEILECSGRLPVIMSWLAAPEGNEPDISIPANDIVERFLRWITEPNLRQVALLGAIPRIYNLDILKPLLEDLSPVVDAQQAFDWLQTMPFVKHRSDGWHYHDVVRRMMLNYQRQKSPQMYRQLHTILADFYNTNRYELSPSEEELWTNEQWRKDTLAYTYHFLVADPTKDWGEVLSLFALAVRKYRIFAVEMIELMSLEDVQDELSSEQMKMIQLCHQQLQAMRNGSLQDGYEMFDELCKIDDLSSQAKGHTLAYRGECFRLKGQWAKALRDLNEALQYIPEDIRTITRRGVTYVMLLRYQEALEDLNRAIALDEKDVWAIAVRGETKRRMGLYQEALNDLNQAIALDEKHSWATAMRGETYRQMERYEESLRDFERAVELDENDSWAITRRDQLKLYQDSLTDSSKTSPSDPSIQILPSPQAPPIPSWQLTGQNVGPYVSTPPMEIPYSPSNPTAIPEIVTPIPYVSSGRSAYPEPEPDMPHRPEMWRSRQEYTTAVPSKDTTSRPNTLPGWSTLSLIIALLVVIGLILGLAIVLVRFHII